MQPKGKKSLNSEEVEEIETQIWKFMTYESEDNVMIVIGKSSVGKSLLAKRMAI